MDAFLLFLQRDETELRSHIISNYRSTARKEHARILQRRQIIEERKEELENISTQRVSIVIYSDTTIELMYLIVIIIIILYITL